MADTTKRQDIIVRILCVVFAFALWLYVTNIENPTTTREIDGVEVRFINEDKLIENQNLILSPEQDIAVTLTIEGPTSIIYNVKAEDFRVEADLSAYFLQKGVNEIRADISSYPRNINVKNNTGSIMVKIDVDEYALKDVPVYPDIDVNTQTGSYAGEPQLTPTSAQISGPSTYVNRVKYLLARGEISNAESDQTVSLNLQPVDENFNFVNNVTVEPTNVSVTVPIRQSKFLTVNVKTQGELPPGLQLKSIEVTPQKVEVIGDEEVLNSLTSIDTEPIDLSKLSENGEVKAKLVIADKISLVEDNSTVLVKINTVEKVQKTFTVPISIINLSEGLSSELGTPQVTILAEAEASIMEGVTAEDFKVEVNAAGLREGAHELSITVTTAKSDIRIVNYTPELVNITINAQ
ncbi:CdaR family protein [Alloiococcus sp. CFN-8]|uniref:CdaR family protein n=1 Tax=Alloiococcus sp. CFN-8 TaxID=3416081 RepID=UPI003CF8C949